MNSKTEDLIASLRGYQSFGARFALVQRKVIIGDEMGLGKTVEAMAVLAHLGARGAQHFLVVCPAAVVTNWMREMSARSTLHRASAPRAGSGSAQPDSGEGKGGVAVTTYDTRRWLDEKEADLKDLAVVVVDEAQYIKNPEAKRSADSRRLLSSGERAILLTGTPLENRIGEFGNLVSYLRPGSAGRMRRIARAAEVSARGGSGVPASQSGRCADRAARTDGGRGVAATWSAEVSAVYGDGVAGQGT